MNQIAIENVKKPMSWIDNRCRSLVFAELAKLEEGELEIEEQNQRCFFPKNIKDGGVRAKICVHDSSLYRQFVKEGSIGVAEAFISGKWTSPDLTAVIRLFARNQRQTDSIEQNRSWLGKIKDALGHWKNRNSLTGSKRNILAHYDIGNELYTRFLDPQMMYSAAIYPNEHSTLAEAQIHKLEVICQKLSLTEADHLLEIGTGWGGLAIYAAQNYGCRVTTTTISDEQFSYAAKRITDLGLTDQITLLKKDYRQLTGKYDKLVSIEMIEAVGYQYLPSFFSQCHDRLKEGGKLLIQSITIADQRFEHYHANVDFIQRYIFPGGFLPSINVLSSHMTKYTSLVIESMEDIGLHYARTLADWRSAFIAAWPKLTGFGYDDQFKRLWLYYLAYCEGAFLERSTSTVHLVARK